MRVARNLASPLTDRNEIAAHVAIIHERAAHACQHLADPGLLQLSRLNPANDKLEVVGRYEIGDTDRMAIDAEIEANNGRNVYVEGRTVRRDLPPTARGKATDTIAVFALVADSDGYKGRASIARGRPAIIQSSPGNEHQWYFFEVALPCDEARALGAVMRAVAGGDDDTGTPTQPYRVAGTPNFPTARKRRDYGKVDAPTKILSSDFTLYSAEAFRLLWPAAPPAAETPPDHHVGDEELDFDNLLGRCSERLRQRLLADDITDRSADFYATTGFMRKEGFTLEQATVLWEGHQGSAADKYEGRLADEVRRAWGKVKDRPRKPPSNDIITEDNAARAFADRYAGQLRYDHDVGVWFEWDGASWRRTKPGLAFYWARKLARELVENEDPRVRFIAGKAGFAGSVEKFARTDAAFAVTCDVWDVDPWLLGTPGGTIELRTGQLREPDPANGITRLTSIAPADTSNCPRWRAFLDEATAGNAATIRFLQQWFGYCLTGVTTEHALLFALGPGGNGKSVFINTLRRILNSYAVTAAMETFVAGKFGGHPTDLAMLRGARLVTASETEEGRPWAEARIKAITGGDPITARFMRQDFFTFDPQFKLTIVGNHMPVLRNVDEAARRRFNIVPFNHRPAVVDRLLEEKLTAEAPEILRWAIEGCLDWQRDGLQRPEAVVAETEAYFEEQDLFGQWLEENCRTGSPMAFTTTRDLFGSWSQYARHAGEVIGTEKSFAAQMARKGITVSKTSRGRGYKGVTLLLEEALA